MEPDKEGLRVRGFRTEPQHRGAARQFLVVAMNGAGGLPLHLFEIWLDRYYTDARQRKAFDNHGAANVILRKLTENQIARAEQGETIRASEIMREGGE